MLKKIAAAALATIACAAYADDREDFCRGYAEGYKSVKGGSANPPACPGTPGIPGGSTAFREGLKAGQVDAKR
jgi:hypothetical protein